MYQNLTYTTVPASHGVCVYVAMPVWDDKNKCSEFHEVPVVAWNVIVFDGATGAQEGRSQAMPVIAEDCLNTLYFLKMPDGTYDLPDDRYSLTKSEAMLLATEIGPQKP